MRVTWLSKGVFVGLTLAAASAFAADYPSKDVHIIVPFKPGGGVDTTARILAEYGNKSMTGGKLTIENRAGGDGVVGQTFAAKAKPDGYTVLAATSSYVTNPMLKKTEFQVEDFRPVAMFNMDPEIIAVGADSPFKTVADFVAEAKKRPITTAIAGIGTSHHMAGLALEDASGIKLNYIPTKDFGSQLQAVMGGHVEMALWPLGEAKKHADAGSVRILAVADTKRLAAFPDAPTWTEAGLNVKMWTTFRGWAVPKGTPEAAVAYLSDLLGKISRDPGYKAQMEEYGFPVVYADAKEFGEIVADYAALSRQVIAKHNLVEK